MSANRPSGKNRSALAVSRRKKKRQSYRPALERLEARDLMAVFTVNTKLDLLGNLTTGKDASGRVSLRSAIMASNNIGGANEIRIQVPADGSYYTLSRTGTGDDGGDLDIRSNLAIKSFTGATISANSIDRVFEIQPGISVSMSGLSIFDGKASIGGGIYNAGKLTLTDVHVSGTIVSGSLAQGGAIFNKAGAEFTMDGTVGGSSLTGTATGSDGVDGTPGTAGSPNGGIGSDGGWAQGGGLYNAGTAMLKNVALGSSAAYGGKGGNGGDGFDFSGEVAAAGAAGVHGGNGGHAGKAGNAEGGAIFNAGTSLTLLNVYGSGSVFAGTGGSAGRGGGGGHGGNGDNAAGGRGGDGGLAGNATDGGYAAGGVVYSSGGRVFISSDAYAQAYSLSGNLYGGAGGNGATSGNGGAGGHGSNGITPTSTGSGTAGKAGGAGGNALRSSAGRTGGATLGGVINVQAGTLTVRNMTLNGGVYSGPGGAGSAGGHGGAGGVGGGGGNGNVVNIGSGSGGAGGAGGAGGVGGAGGKSGFGGAAIGGAVRILAGNATIISSSVSGAAYAGAGNYGSSGGYGGTGGGGGNGGYAASSLPAVSGGAGGAGAVGGNAGQGGSGGTGGNALGGGVYSTGVLTLERSTITSSVAYGGNSYQGYGAGYAGAGGAGGSGGPGASGGSDGAGGAGANGGNAAVSGNGGTAGHALGGGLHIKQGILRNVTLTYNQVYTYGGSTPGESIAPGEGGAGGTGSTTGSAGARGATAAAALNGNNGAAQGAGIRSTGGVTLINGTVAENVATATSAVAGIGGGVRVAAGVFRLRNTVIARNTSTGAGIDVNGVFTSDGTNFIGLQTGGSGFNSTKFDIFGTTSAIDPRLDTFTTSSGPSGGAPGTMTPLFGSPLINAGRNGDYLDSDVDEIGYKRIHEELVDIGAVEFQGSRAALAGDSERALLTPSGYSIYRGVSAAFINQKITAEGSRVIDVEVESTSPYTFTVTMVRNEGAHQKVMPSGFSGGWFYDLTPASMAAKVAAANARVIDYNAYVKDGVLKVAVAVVSNTTSLNSVPKTYKYYHGETLASLAQHVQDNNARIVDLGTYVEASQRRFTAVMISNTGIDAKVWWYYFGKTPAEISTLLSENGARPMDLEARGDGTFDVVMVKAKPGERWTWYYGLPADTALDRAEEKGMRIFSLEPYTLNGNTVTAALMLNNATTLAHRANDALRAAGLGGRSGASLKEVGGSVLGQIYEQHRFQPASMLKVLLHLGALRQVQAGNWSLSMNVNWYYRPGDNINNATKGNTGTDPLTFQETASNRITETLQVVLERMMEVSDNRATYAIQKLLGPAGIQATIDAAGLTQTVYTQVIGAPISGNTFTLADANQLYEKVADGTLLGTGNFRNQFYRLMLDENTSDQEGVALADGISQSIAAVVREEAARKLGLAITDAVVLSLAADFLAQMTNSSKGGDYRLAFTNANWHDYHTDGGTFTVSFKEGGVLDSRRYVYSVFIEEALVPTSEPGLTTATNKVFAARTNAVNELFRDRIRAAIATW